MVFGPTVSNCLHLGKWWHFTFLWWCCYLYWWYYYFLNVIRFLICKGNLNWLLDLNLTLERYWGSRWKVTCRFYAGKHSLFHSTVQKNFGANDVKIDRTILQEKPVFRMMGLSLISKLDLGLDIRSIVMTAFEKSRNLIRPIKFVSPEVALYLYKSSIWSCKELWSYLGWSS